MMDAIQSNRKAILLVALVFVLGIALGAGGVYVLTTRVHAARAQAAAPGGRSPASVVARLDGELNLTPDQEKKIEAILTDTQARYAEIHRQADPEYDQARHQGRVRIREVLTPEQQPKFDQFLRRVDEERRRRQSENSR
jgi:Spy/CpxP family protein refolding chaperone